MSRSNDDVHDMNPANPALDAFLDEVRALGDVPSPAPSSELRALLTGERPLEPAMPRIGRKVLTTFAVAASAIGLLVAGAATHQLPAQAQRLVSNVVNTVTPFHIEPDRTGPYRPAQPSHQPSHQPSPHPRHVPGSSAGPNGSSGPSGPSGPDRSPTGGSTAPGSAGSGPSTSGGTAPTLTNPVPTPTAPTTSVPVTSSLSAASSKPGGGRSTDHPGATNGAAANAAAQSTGRGNPGKSTGKSAAKSAGKSTKSAGKSTGKSTKSAGKSATKSTGKSAGASAPVLTPVPGQDSAPPPGRGHGGGRPASSSPRPGDPSASS